MAAGCFAWRRGGTATGLRMWLLSATCLAIMVPYKSYADCDGTTGAVTCSGTTSTIIGTGAGDAISNLTIGSTAQVSTSGTAISMGSGTSSNPNIINIDGSVTGAGQGNGPYGNGPNVVEFGGNTDVTVSSTGSIIQSGGASNGEAINPTGGNNIITNYGLIETSTSSAMWFQGSDSATDSIPNVIDNYGTITAGNSIVIGNSSSSTIYFTNESGATVNGNITLGSSGSLKNIVTFYEGSTVNGSVSGGGSAATLNLTGDNGTDSLTDAVSGFGTLNKDGTGVWTVGAANAPLTSLSPTLAVNVNDGTLVLGGNTSVTQATVTINSGGTLQLGQGGTTGWIDGITYDNGTLAFDRSDTNTFASDIANNTSLDPAGKGGVEQEGTGTTILTGTNTYSGGTVITAGTLQIGDGGTSGSITGDVTNDSNLVFDRSDATTFAGDISGSGNVSQIGTGSTILTNADTYSGTTTITQGSLQLGDGNTSGTIANTAAIVDNGNLTVDNPAATTLSQVISGTGSLTQSGGGTTTLTSVDTYSGATTIQNGTLALYGTGSIAASDGVHDDSTFDVSGVSASATTVNALDGSGALVLGNKNLTVADGNTAFGNVFSGQASGTGGSLTIASGTETLSGANIYTGGTTVASGAGLDLSGSVVGNVADNGTTTLDGGTVGGTIADNGTLAVTANGGTAGSLSGSGTGTLAGGLTLTSAADTYAGALSGTGGLTVAGGTETLSGANTYTGSTTIGSGAVLQLGAGGTTGSIDGTSGIDNSGSLVIDRSNNVTLAAAISGAGSLVQQGSGVTTLTGTNSYSGGTTIASGTLAGNTTSFGSGAITDNAALDVDLASGVTDALANTVSGTGTLTKTGSGTLEMDNSADSYSGGTLVSAGTMQVDGDESHISGMTTVASGATLSGIGTMGGDVTIASGGTLSPGDGSGSVGHLSISGNLTEDAGSTANFDMGQAGVVAGKYNDLVSVGGNLTMAGTLNVTQSAGGDFGPGVYRLYDYGGTLTNNGVTLAGTDETLQTSVDKEVNLVVTDANMPQQYWDGANVNGDHGSDGAMGNGQVDGGSGVWTAPGGSGDGNWTNSAGTGNTPSTQGAFDVFEGKAGTVTVDDSNGNVTLSGAQFANSDAESGAEYVITGDTLYSSGSDLTLRVGDGTAVGAATTAVIDSVIDDSQVAGGTTLVKTDGGTLVLNGDNNYSGGTDIKDGTVVGSATSFGSGTITAEAGSGLVIDQTTDGTLTNGLSGSGTLDKEGAGDLTVTGDDSAFTGNTTINGGTLSVDGSLANSDVTVAGGGTLAGTGTVGSTTVADGGILSPANGNALGTLTVNGDLNVNNGSTYLVNGGAAGQSDLVAVTGTALLAGGTVEFNVANGTTLKPGTEYTILTAQNGVSGQFSGLSTNLTDEYTFLSPQLLYTADDVDITLERNGTSFTSVANTRNERDIAAALDGMTGGNAMVSAIEQLSGSQARKAFDSLSGEIHASARTALIQDSFYVRNAAIDRLRNASCDPGGDTAQKTATLKGRRTDGTCQQDHVTLWGEAFGSWGHNSGDGNAGGMNHSVGGFVLGADAPVFNTWRVGGLVSYGRSTFSTEGTDAYGHSNNVTVGGYAGTHWGHLALRMGATYTWAMMSTSRSASFPGFYEKLNSSYNGGVAQGFGDLGYRFDLGKTAIEPFGNVAYVNMHTDSFHEHGGAAALNGRAIDTGTTYSTFGVRMSSTFHAGNVLLVPEGSLAYRHTFGATVPTTREAFAAGGSSFDVAGVPLSRDAAVLNAGLRAHLTDRLELGISYIGQYGNRSVDSGLRGRFAWKF